MELVNHLRPHRAIVRCKAKMQLLETAGDSFECYVSVDDALLQELASTLFQSERYRVISQQCRSRREAREAEDILADILAQTYRNIFQRQQEPIVQNLNALL